MLVTDHRSPLTADERAGVVAEALRWCGTPYHHHGRVFGPAGGVDCGTLLIEVYSRAGVIPGFDPGYYARDWMRHRAEEVYLDHVRRRAREVDSPGLGDVVLMRFDRTWSHGGILVDDSHIVHAYIRARTVCVSALHEFERPMRFFEVMR